MKQTAVEWFKEKVEQYILTYGNLPLNVLSIFKQEAQEMEKQQKIMDYEMGYINGGNQKNISGEQYINETYGGNK